MRMLITGATGRVGSRFTPRALQRGRTVRILVRRSDHAEHLRRLGAEVVEGDLAQPETLARAVAGMDAVVHLAAFFRGATEEQTRAVNTDGTLALAHAAMQAGVPRFVFVSTNLVYGSGQNRLAREDDPLQPVRAYPESKAAAEQALMELHRAHGLGLRVVRLAFVYGEGDPHLAEALPMVATWHPAKRLQMVHHADVSQALLMAVTIPGLDGRIYNVADDAPLTVAELRQHLGQPEVPDGSSGEALTDPWEGLVSTLRLRDELGFRPIYPSLYTARDAGAL